MSLTAAFAECNKLILSAAPLAPLATGLIAGVALDAAVSVNVPFAAALFIASGCLLAIRRVRTVTGPLLLFLMSVCVGSVLHFNAVRAIPHSSVERLAHEHRRIARLRGTVSSPPRLIRHSQHPFARWMHRSDRTAFLLDVHAVRGRQGEFPAAGRVRVTVGEALLDLQEAEPVEVTGWLSAIPRDRAVSNPGSFDWARFYRRQGIVARLRCGHRENVVRLTPDSRPSPGLLAGLRQHVRELLTSDLAAGTDEEASLLEAMILGHRSRLDRRLNDVFIRAGCAHFLAVSGVHVVIVMLLARLMFRMFLLGPRAQTWGMMLAIAAYMLLAEPRPPILRAGTIALLYCTAKLMGRERACLNWIGASAILLVAAQPAAIFDAGFQLSFAAVVGVSYLTPAITGFARELRQQRAPLARVPDKVPKPRHARRLAPDDVLAPGASRPVHRRLGNYVGVALAITIAAWLATAPIVAWHFQRIQPWGSLNSVIMLLPVTAVMALGFAKVSVSVLVPPLGGLAAGALTWADTMLIRLAELLGALPGASTVVTAPPWWLIGAYYVFLLSLIWRFQFKLYEPPFWVKPNDLWQRAWRWAGPAAGCSLAGLLVALTVWHWPFRATGRLAVTVLAVGAGTATVVELPDGRALIYDAGSAGTYDVGRSTIVPFLRHRRIRRIDRVYISHPDMDHFNGLPSVLAEVPAGPVIVNRYFDGRSPPRSPSRHLLRLLEERGHPLRVLEPQSRRWERGGVTFEHLWPVEGLDPKVSSNDTSTVLRIRYAGRSILLTGDIETTAQRALLTAADLRCDVLVLPHHGSIGPASKAFIDAADPLAVVRSSGERMADSFRDLTAVLGDRPLYNTADCGAVTIVFEDGAMEVSPAHGGNGTTRKYRIARQNHAPVNDPAAALHHRHP